MGMGLGGGLPRGRLTEVPRFLFTNVIEAEKELIP